MDKMSFIEYAALIAFVVFVFFWGYLTHNANTPDIPRCPEDAVIVGYGEFENGWYKYYACGPAVDDYNG